MFAAEIGSIKDEEAENWIFQMLSLQEELLQE
jgi:hypothetical protein